MKTIIAHNSGYAYRCAETDNCRIEGMRGANLADAIDRAATSAGGFVSCYLGDGAYFRARMPLLGQTPALPIPRRQMGKAA